MAAWHSKGTVAVAGSYVYCQAENKLYDKDVFEAGTPNANKESEKRAKGDKSAKRGYNQGVYIHAGNYMVRDLRAIGVPDEIIRAEFLAKSKG